MVTKAARAGTTSASVVVVMVASSRPATALAIDVPSDRARLLRLLAAAV
jgi:hypothetical protein